MTIIKSTKRFFSLKAICPHYKSEDKQVLYCEGIQKDTAMHIAFAYPADKVAYKEKHCESNYQDCRIAQMLEDADD